MITGKYYKVPAVMRALDIIEFLGTHEQMSFMEISRKLGLPKTSTYQILNTLEQRGYIKRVNDGIQYKLGLKLYELGNLAIRNIDIRAEATPILRELANKTNQSCHLAIMTDVEGVYLVKIEGDQPIRLNSWEGKKIPLHCSAMGKILMAWQDDATIDQLLKKIELTRYTENTLTDPEQLKAHLRMIKSQGWAINDEEHFPFLRAVAAPVTDADGKVFAAMDVIGLVTDLTNEALPEYVKLVKGAAAKLSAALGPKPGRSF